MNPRILASIFLLTLAAVPAAAAPTASFTARKIQGATCLAPCAVHFDAIGQGSLSTTPFVTPETTDPDFDREFHSLLFVWDFGDPNSGEWTTGAASATANRASKNSDIGGIAGHVYERPGVYTVTLTVTNPSGQTNTTVRSVTVGDRTTFFSAADTFCFANDDSNWAGCPLNCAGGDDNCTVTSSLQTAFTAADNCAGADDCANADSTQRRILLRRGDRFVMSNYIRMNEGTTPGFVEAFGSGPRPIIDEARAPLEGGDHWTWTEVAFRNCSTHCIFMNVNNDSSTYFRVDAADYQDACFDESTSWPVEPFDTYAKLHAFVEMNCTGSVAAGYAAWPGADYVMWMGGTFNADPGALGNTSTVRSHHTQHYLISHLTFLNPSPTRENLQLRQDDDGSPDANRASGRFVLVSDNLLEESASNTFFTVRMCVDSGCNCGEGNCDAAMAGRIVPLQDFVFERNFHYWDAAPVSAKFGGIYEVQGGGVTVRNNVYDLQEGFTGGYALVVATGSPNVSVSGSTPAGDVHVYNNTLYFDQPLSSRFDFTATRATGTGCPQNCFARNNLLVAPNFTGTVGSSPAFTSSNNMLLRTPSPFVSAVPPRGATNIASFRLASASASPVNAGYNFSPAANRSAWVYDDAFGGCRTAATTGAWDVGAHEFGAPLCIQSSGGGAGTTLLPPTLLAPR